MSDRMQMIHVGLGGWGMDWERNALPPVADTVERVAIVEAHAPTLASARTSLGLPADRCFDDLDAAMDATGAELVLITAPMAAHVPLAVQALEAGRHVLVEKPFAGTLAEARQAVDVAERTGRTLMVSQNYRFYPAPRTVARLVAEGELGAVGPMFVDFRKAPSPSPDPASKHYRVAHALLFDMSIHHYDLMRMVLGQEAVSVHAVDTSPPWSLFDDEGAAVLTIAFAGGQVVSYRGSWVSTGDETTWGGDWRLECERGELRWTSRAGFDIADGADAVLLRKGRDEPVGVELDAVPLLGRSMGLKQLAESIRAGVEPESSGRANLGTVAIMEAAVRSLASGVTEPMEQIG